MAERGTAPVVPPLSNPVERADQPSGARIGHAASRRWGTRLKRARLLEWGTGGGDVGKALASSVEPGIGNNC